MEISEFDMAIQEASSVAIELNAEVEKFFVIQANINAYQMRRLRPFSLENGDMDAGLEELIQGAHNVVSRIKNFIIKLWYTLKNVLDKMLHLFSSTLKKLKGYQDLFKSGIDQSKFAAFPIQLSRCIKKLICKRDLMFLPVKLK